MDEQEQQIVIKFNTVSCREICPICNEWMDKLLLGPCLFLEGTFSPVCEECGIKHAPELVGVLDRFWTVGWDGSKSNYPEPFERAAFDGVEDIPDIPFEQ